jgi:short-subunit dehydrogenase
LVDQEDFIEDNQGLRVLYLIGNHGEQMSDQPVLLITGASSGIGAATARYFGSRGYRVVLAARRLDRLEELAHEISRAGGEALSLAVDVTKPEQVQELVSVALERFKRIDVLFNNAGFGRLNWLEALDPQVDVEALLQVNLNAVIRLTQVVLPVMIAQKSGHIINMSSVAGFIAPPTFSIYSASKFALRGFTEALRREVGVLGIRVSGIYPGAVETEFSQHTGAARKTGFKTPGWLLLSSEDVAQAVWKLVQRPRRTLVMPAVMHLAIWLNRALPGLIDWILEIAFVHPERKSSMH